MRSAVLYARYSSHNQREVSIDDQLKVCRDFCERENIDVVSVYTDAAMTGTNDKRPDFQRMIRKAPESDYVVVYKLDRFSRDKYDAPLYKKKLEDKGVKVLSATEGIPEGSSGVFLEKMLEAQAAFYSLSLSENVLRGMNSNAEKCLANGVYVFGYDIDPEGHYVINEEEAAVVREVFKRYTEGEAMYSIARDLGKRGYRTQRGNIPGESFINSIIHNEKYIGVYKWGSHVIQDGMPAIITQQEFIAAQTAPRKKVRMDENWREYKLVGKLICGECGKPMHGQSTKNRYGKRYNYYACRKKDGCGRKPIRCEIVEEALLKGLQDVADNPETARTIARQVCDHYQKDNVSEDARDYEQKLKTIKSKKSKLLDLFLAGAISEEDFTSKNEELGDQEEATLARLGALHAEELELTEDDLVEFLLHGFAQHDEDMLFNGFLHSVYLYDDCMVAMMNFADDVTNDYASVKIALETGNIIPVQIVANGKSLHSLELAGPAGFEPT